MSLEAKLDALLERKMESALERFQKRANPNEDRWKGSPKTGKRNALIESAGSIPTASLDHHRQHSPHLLRGFTHQDFEKTGYEVPASKEYFGLRAARVIRAGIYTGFDMNRVPRVLADNYGDRNLADFVTRQLETGTPSAGGLLVVPELLVAEFIPFLRAESNIMQLGAREIPMVSGSMLLPGQSTGVTGGWVGEGQDRNAEVPSLYQVRLSSKTAWALSYMTEDLLQQASVEIDEMVRDDLVSAIVEIIEDAAINGKGTEHSPRGLRYNPRLTDVSIAAQLDAFDPGKFIRQLLDAKVRFQMGNMGASGRQGARQMGWLYPPIVWEALRNLATTTGAWYYRDEMNNGTLEGFPFRVSTQIPVRGAESNDPTDMYFGDWRQLILGVTRNLEVKMSDQASFKDEAGTVRHGFPEGLLAIKVTKKLDVGVKQGVAMSRSIDVQTS